MKKTICSLLIIAILMNFVLCNSTYADTGGQSGGSSTQEASGLTEQGSPSQESATSLQESGEVTGPNGETQKADSGMGGSSILGTILGFLAFALDIIPLQLQVMLSTLTFANTSEPVTCVADYMKKFWISIDRIVFNKIPLFNINYFDVDTQYSVGTGAHEVIVTSDNANLDIKASISKMYIVCRAISLVASLLVLIYIGIRMALSTISSDKARYKKMLVSWIESIVLLMLLVYIMVFVINLGEIFINIFYNIKCDLESAGQNSFEVVLIDSLIDSIFNASGMNLALYSIMYWVLIFTHVKFFFLYIKRTLLVGFLIMIAPLITITYPIDKAGDGKAQAFNAWLSEFLTNVLIQPLHCAIYLVFMFTAGEIAKYAPLLGLIFLLSLGTVEKVIKRMFNVGKLASLGGINDLDKKGKKGK